MANPEFLIQCFSARPAWKALGSSRSPQAPRSSCAIGHQTSSTGAKTSINILLNRNGADVYMKFPCCTFTFRNDADVVAVRNGCTFTGWTGSGYDGETFTVTAGPGPRDR